MKHIINLAKKPFCPKDWTVETHIKGDEDFEWNVSKVELFLSEKQKENYQVGVELQKEIINPFNANLLDYLLEHTELIPLEYKDKYVFFWGTIYRHAYGILCVRCLRWSGGRWFWSYHWLGNDFHVNDPAAVLASSPKNLSHSLNPLPLVLEIKIGDKVGKYQLIK